jgi:hypothetical protein
MGQGGQGASGSRHEGVRAAKGMSGGVVAARRRLRAGATRAATPREKKRSVLAVKIEGAA